MFKATFLIAARNWEPLNVQQLMNKHDTESKGCHITVNGY